MEQCLPAQLIYTYRGPDAAPYLVELKEHAGHQPLFRLQTLVVQEDPRPVLALFDDVQDLTSREVYISGPPLFARAVIEELHRRGVSRSQLHYEDFDFRSSQKMRTRGTATTKPVTDAVR
jgi:ferredoxin-NADP reductase